MRSRNADENPESTKKNGYGRYQDEAMEKIWKGLFDEVKIYETKKTSSYRGAKFAGAAEN